MKDAHIKIIAFLIYVLSFNLTAQTKIDSLFRHLNKVKADTAKISLYEQLCAEYFNLNNLDSSEHYAELQLKLSRQILNSSVRAKTRVAQAHKNLGFVFQTKADAFNAIKHYTSALELYVETGNEGFEGIVCYGLGQIYRNQADRKSVV